MTCAIWLIDQVGFGDFIFRLPDRKTEVARASNLNELEQALRTVPAESISYHAGRNHFSHWLMARTEFAVAQKLRPRKVSDFASIEVLRRDLIDAITSYRREQSQNAGRRFQSRDVSARGHVLPAHRRRLAGRQGARTGFRATLAASQTHAAAVLREFALRSAHGRAGHRCVRPFHRRKRAARLRHALPE